MQLRFLFGNNSLIMPRFSPIFPLSGNQFRQRVVGEWGEICLWNEFLQGVGEGIRRRKQAENSSKIRPVWEISVWISFGIVRTWNDSPDSSRYPSGHTSPEGYFQAHGGQACPLVRCLSGLEQVPLEAWMSVEKFIVFGGISLGT